MWDTTGTPVRGTEYVIVFDQTKIDTDDVGTNAPEVANTTDGTTAPYLTAPDALTITAPAAGATSYKVTFKSGNKDYAGLTNVAAFTTIGSGTVYVQDAADSTTNTTLGSITAKLDKGSITQDGLTTSVAGKYYGAKVSLKAGYSGAEKVDLVADPVVCGKAVTAKATLAKDSTDAKKVKVTFDALHDSAKIYMTQDTDKLSVDDPATYSKYEEVAKGATSIEISEAMTAAGDWYRIDSIGG